MRTIDTDYLVVGSGMSGMGFVDSLLDVSDADVVMVDRRHAPGGHWLECYPFVKLHQPSSWYGVGSTPLGDDQVERDGPEQGMYARASGIDLRAYFARVMRDRFLPSGRVRYFPMSDYLGDRRFRASFGGEETEVRVRQKVVDATYAPSETPESFPPPFEIADGAHVVTPTELTQLRELAGVVIVGTGKTAVDTCIWLLENGCSPDAITWVRTRDSWFNNRYFMQPGDRSVQTVEGTVRFLEALAASGSIDEACERLEGEGVVMRVDPSITPTLFRGAMMSEYEMDQVRRIHDVVRAGRVRSVRPDRMVLDEGEVSVTPGHVFVHCAAPGVSSRRETPVFGDSTITVQYLARASLSLSSAAIARVETLDLTDDEKNELCPPRRMHETPLEYAHMLVGGLATEMRWGAQPALQEWMAASRVNVVRDAVADPAAAALYGRLVNAFGPASERLAQFDAA